MIKALTVILSISLLVGCAGTPKTKLIKETALSVKETTLSVENTLFIKKNFLNPSECSVIPLTKEEKSIKRSMVLLEHFFEEWKSVKHRMGGMSKRGVDCSGLVQLMFKNQFDVKIPRTTASQVRLGKTVSKNKLKAGDLVFFKTNRHTRHVGIYLKDNIFIHTSSSKGVMKSRLNQNYWAKRYWTAKRIDFKVSDFFNEVIRRGRV